MQFNPILLLLLFFMITFVQPLHGQRCNCVACLDRVTVSANSDYKVYNSAPCPAGKAAAVSELNVESTDGSGFQIYTQDDPSQTTYYTAASTTSSVPCFNMGDGRRVGGQKSRIYVVISCNNWIQPCPLRYSISLVCVPVTTTSTPKSTSASTVKPVNPSTPEPTSSSTVKPVNPSTPEPTPTSTVKPVNPSTPEPTPASTVKPGNPSTPKPTPASTVKPVNPSTPDFDKCVCHCCRNGYSSIIAGGTTIVDIQRCRPSSYDGTIIKLSTTCTIALCRQSCIDQVSSCADAVTLIPGSKSDYKVELEATCRGHSVMVGRVIFVLLSVVVSGAALLKN